MIRGTTLGLVTPDHALARCVDVTVDGTRVTRKCIAADDRQGWALCYYEDGHGAKHVDDRGRLRPQLMTGAVEFHDNGSLPR